MWGKYEEKMVCSDAGKGEKSENLAEKWRSESLKIAWCKDGKDLQCLETSGLISLN